MLKNRILFLVTFFFICSSSFASELKPLSIVVVGGGPTGLAAAIEAHSVGADVTIVEKRSTYTRNNTLFLYTVTLDLFDKWNVKVPQMTELYLKDERRGFVLIKHLEESLAKRVDELGIKRIYGEFKDITWEGRQAAIIKTADEELSVSYDILVGADGANSLVREKLRIPCTCIAKAIGGAAMVPATNPEKAIGVEIREHKDVFAKKVTIPFATILFIQNRPDAGIEKISKQEVIKFAKEVGWQDEAEKIETNGILNIENIPVSLQRAKVFSNAYRSAILLGDAAGNASFYRGTGVNFALKTAELAGVFFKQVQQFGFDCFERDYDCFDRDMERAVDVLIQDSMHLFAK